jgi:hypothetical protein
MEQLLSANEIAEDRAIAEAQMIDVCTISMPGVGKGPFNETTMKYDTPARVIVYGPGAVDKETLEPLLPDSTLNKAILAGKYRIQVRSDINSNAVEAVVAEHEWTYRTATMQLPILGSGHLESNYVANIVTCTYDDSLTGRQFNLQAETKGKSQATHRRFRIRELMG